MKAYLGIGTNIGDRMLNLQNAIDSVNLLPNTMVTQISNVYETAPVGYAEQDDFLNIAVEVETAVNSDVLLGYILGIEAGMGRVRTIKNGPRVVDIDLLLYGDEIKTSEHLILPHPRMWDRGFVLIPLLDLDFSNRLFDKEKIKNTVSYDGVKIYASREILNIE